MNKIVRRLVKATCATIIIFFVIAIGLYESMEMGRRTISPSYSVAALTLAYILCYSKYRVIYRAKNQDVNSEG